ncbi:rRNA-processing protein RRP36 [Ascoidea rubescens DSM 1968]|uniref:rRNA biogenesis protein RRP36 n=1 Tax=Ascoidea rubescens DSM 1968 TaxID=1344418 RepID=A0A1D2VRS5_9ASCO|nr:DUF947-domain-containing protein [Ascoidea rubescens DSM 1968]ODV64322.1 DUF947-domain-containing protein [Ascoidea rubescens DSM 1968]
MNRIKKPANDTKRRPKFDGHRHRDLNSGYRKNYGFKGKYGLSSNLNPKKNSFHKQRESRKDSDESEIDSDSDSDSSSEPEEQRITVETKKKKNKHSPVISSAKRPVSVVREIPGLLDNTRYSKKASNNDNLFGDIRFNPVYGKPNFERIRNDYKFLDDYRKDEIKNLQSVLKNKKLLHKLSENEVNEYKLDLQQLRSKQDSVRNRDLEIQIRDEFREKVRNNIKPKLKSTNYYLKKSDQKKLMQIKKFESMNKTQKDRLLERKRKRKLGQEYRKLEFLN